MVDHETLRRWLICEGLWRWQRKRGPHRKWRPPKEHFGELVQMDGSFHDWLGIGEQSCLIDLVDDATARMSGHLQHEETTEGAMKAFLKSINDKFAHSPASTVDYHRPVPAALRLEDMFVFEETRSVQNDWTLNWDRRWYQITGPRSLMPRRRERIVVL